MHKGTKIKIAHNRQVLNLREYLNKCSHSLLCVGPMSRNCVDAVIDFANANEQPIPLIASRRQIEAVGFGGGYVNRWHTRDFASYVTARDKGYVHLCRDHGGPWQGNDEEGLSLTEAMVRAKESLLEDIVSGFDVLHLDPSIPGVPLTDNAVVELLLELYSFVIESSRALGRSIEIEIGAEQQSGGYSEPHELTSLLNVVSNFCEKHRYKKPLFCVVQTGTLVREMRNIGMTEGRKNEVYDQKYAVDSMEKAVQYLVKVSRINGVYVKEHNGDYLSDGSLALRRKLGIGGVNIAPELGVCESRSLLRIGTQLGLSKEMEQMLEIFYRSQKWEKWLSVPSSASDFEKSIIAGHYCFSKPEFIEIYDRINRAAVKRNIDLSQYLADNLHAILQRLSWNLGYFHQKYGDLNYEQHSNSQIV